MLVVNGTQLVQEVSSSSSSNSGMPNGTSTSSTVTVQLQNNNLLHTSSCQPTLSSIDSS